MFVVSHQLGRPARRIAGLVTTNWKLVELEAKKSWVVALCSGRENTKFGIGTTWVLDIDDTTPLKILSHEASPKGNKIMRFKM